MSDKVFQLTELHIKLLRAMYVSWDDCEYGAPAIDPKRPYGNSSVAEDIREITGLDLSDEEAYDLHKETQTALQVLLSCLTVKPGRYVKISEYDNTLWSKVVDKPLAM